jgi:UDP-N-acetylglucosamine 3-dehydrogenase
MKKNGSAAPIRIAIIGAGIAGQRHGEAFARHPAAVVAAVADIDAHKSREVARRWGARCFTDYREMLSIGVDAVVICLPHALHLACAKEAARAGAHILMEKPLATTLEDARAIVEAAHQARVQLMLGYVHRFRPEVEAARQLIIEGRIGRPATALDRFMSGGIRDTPRWVWNAGDAGGGVIMYGGVHAVDRLRWLLGEEITEVYARTKTYSNPSLLEDGVCAILTFASGATAVLYENAPGFGRIGPWTTEVFGTAGAVIITTGASLEYRNVEGAQRWTYPEDRRFDRQADEFLRAIAEGRPPSVGGEDGLRGVAVALAIYRSAASGRPEPVPQ